MTTHQKYLTPIVGSMYRLQDQKIFKTVFSKGRVELLLSRFAIRALKIDIDNCYNLGKAK